MIPILYEHDEYLFNTFGIGPLAEASSCEVTEERNGGYELVLKYPTNGRMISEITKERLLRVQVNDNKSIQTFRIYRISVPINGFITVYAQHISYDLSGIVVFPCVFDGSNPQQMMTFLAQRRADRVVPFTFFSDISDARQFAIEQPRTFRSVLGAEKDSIAALFGGEFLWDNSEVKFLANRGVNNGVTILYGKNLTKLEHNTDLSGVYSHLCPFAKIKEGDTITYLELQEKKIALTTTLNETKVLIKDFSSLFGSGEGKLQPTEANLRQVANDFILANPTLGIEVPNITLSFEQLRGQFGYSNLHETINLCDIVTVKYPDLGIDIQTKIVKVVYDVLKEKFKSITIGASKASLVDTTVHTQQEADATSQAVTEIPSYVEQAIKNATDQITGANGGCVVIDYDSNHKPYELLVMNDYDKDEATKVWRWNVNGLGYSPNGYNGPYTTAITADGQIVADFITTGTLTASLIRAGTIASSDNQSYWNLETGDIKLTGEINATTGYISNFKINSDGISTGPTTVNDHTHAGLFLANSGINFSSGVDSTGYSTIMVKPFGTINNLPMGPHLWGEKYTHNSNYTLKNSFILSSSVLSLKSYVEDHTDLGSYVTYRTKIYSNDACQDYVSTFVYPSIESDDEFVEHGKESGLASYTISVGHVWDNWLGYVPDIYIDMVTYSVTSSGNHGQLFGTWRSTSAIVVSSDRNKKKDIEVLDDRYSTFFNNLNPVRFKYRDGKSSRYHTGFIAQEVIEALKESDLSEQELAAICTMHNKDETTELGIRYEELIALCVNEIQRLNKRVKELEDKK